MEYVKIVIDFDMMAIIYFIHHCVVTGVFVKDAECREMD